MGPHELLARLVSVLEGLELQYLVTGSMATIAYGEPRFTNDIDVVVDLPMAKVDAFCACFPAPEYYCSRQAVEQAVRQKFQFNVIHPTSGLKIDVILATDSEFDRSRLGRTVRIASGENVVAAFASPEDVILKKLLYYQEGGSEKHLRDITGVLKVRGNRIDRQYVAQWAERLGVRAAWDLVLARCDSPQTRD